MGLVGGTIGAIIAALIIWVGIDIFWPSGAPSTYKGTIAFLVFCVLEGMVVYKEYNK